MRAARRRPYRGPLPRHPRRAAGQRAEAQPRARRRCSRHHAELAGRMADAGNPIRDQRPSPEALLAEAQREGRGRLKIFLGAAPGRRQDLRDAAPRRRRRRREGVDVVVGVVETHGRARDRGAARRARGHPAPARSTTRAASLDEMDLDAILARRPAARAGRRTRPHQRAGQPPSQALSGCRGAARRRHRRLHDAQHPARREPERRRRADHPHPRARDGARLHRRPGRRDRAGRPHAGGPDRSGCSEGKVYVPEQARARDPALFLAGQPDRAARAGAAPHGAARRRRRCSTTCGRTRSPGPGRRASACWSASASDPARRGAGALRPAARRPAARAVDRALCRDRAHAAARRGRARPHRRRRCGWPSGSAAEAVTVPGARRRRRGRRLCARANNVTQIVIGKSRRVALVRAAARLGRRTS